MKIYDSIKKVGGAVVNEAREVGSLLRQGVPTLQDLRDAGSAIKQYGQMDVRDFGANIAYASGIPSAAKTAAEMIAYARDGGFADGIDAARAYFSPEAVGERKWGIGNLPSEKAQRGLAGKVAEAMDGMTPTRLAKAGVYGLGGLATVAAPAIAQEAQKGSAAEPYTSEDGPWDIHWIDLDAYQAGDMDETVWGLAARLSGQPRQDCSPVTREMANKILADSIGVVTSIRSIYQPGTPEYNMGTRLLAGLMTDVEGTDCAGTRNPHPDGLNGDRLNPLIMEQHGGTWTPLYVLNQTGTPGVIQLDGDDDDSAGDDNNPWRDIVLRQGEYAAGDDDDSAGDDDDSSVDWEDDAPTYSHDDGDDDDDDSDRTPRHSHDMGPAVVTGDRPKRTPGPTRAFPRPYGVLPRAQNGVALGGEFMNRGMAVTYIDPDMSKDEQSDRLLQLSGILNLGVTPGHIAFNDESGLRPYLVASLKAGSPVAGGTLERNRAFNADVRFGGGLEAILGPVLLDVEAGGWYHQMASRQNVSDDVTSGTSAEGSGFYVSGQGLVFLHPSVALQLAGEYGRLPQTQTVDVSTPFGDYGANSTSLTDLGTWRFGLELGREPGEERIFESSLVENHPGVIFLPFVEYQLENTVLSADGNVPQQAGTGHRLRTGADLVLVPRIVNRPFSLTLGGSITPVDIYSKDGSSVDMTGTNGLNGEVHLGLNFNWGR